MEKFDVVVIGAGPGGLKCAEVLARKKNVLVLEKNKAIGAKVCAGGITLKAMKYGVPKRLFEKSFRNFNYYYKDKCVKIKSDEDFVATLKREELGKFQAKEAKKAGAEIRVNSKVSEVLEDYVVVDGKKIGFEFLVGADGVGSIVRKSIGLKSEKMHLAMHYIVKRDFDELEVFFAPRVTKVGYLWIFPHDGFASIGFGFNPRKKDTTKIKKKFHEWLDRKGISVEGAKFEVMPILYDYQGYEFGNKFLVGEAAGLTYGFTGEGIYPALVSGEEVARKILDNKFKPEMIPKVLRKKRYQEIVLSTLENVGPFRNLIHKFCFWLLKRPKWQDRGIRLTLK